MPYPRTLFKRCTLLGAVAVALLAGHGVAAEIDRTFITTIIDRGAPALGSYDVRLRLYDARLGGNLVDSWYEMGRGISEGHLEVALPPVFATRSGLWLEIAVGEAGSGHFEVLPGRQELAAGGGSCTVGTLVINDRVGVGTTAPGAPIHIVSNVPAPLTVPPMQNGLMLGSEETGPPSGWIQSYGRPLVLNPSGTFVGVGSDQIPLATLHVGGSLRADSLQVDGDIVASGYSQPGGGETLRIVRGIVASNGSVTAGSGFSASRSSLGSYEIAFDTSFPSAPTVTLTAFAGNRLATLSGVFNGLVGVDVWDQVGTGRVDSAFHFIAIGPSQ